jgi:CcmD family protein
MDNFWYLFSALVLAWGAVFFYLWSLARRTRDLKLQLDLVQAQLDHEGKD